MKLSLNHYLDDNKEDQVVMEAAYAALDMICSEGSIEESVEAVESLMSQEEQKLDELFLHADMLANHIQDLESLDGIKDKSLTEDEALSHIIKMNASVYETALTPMPNGLGVAMEDMFSNQSDKLVLNNKAKGERKEGMLKTLKTVLDRIWETMKRIAYEWLNPRGRISRQLKALQKVEFDVDRAIKPNRKMTPLLTKRAGAYELCEDLPLVLGMVEEYYTHDYFQTLFGALADIQNKNSSTIIEENANGEVLVDKVVALAKDAGFEGYRTRGGELGFRVPGCEFGLTIQAKSDGSLPLPYAVFSIDRSLDKDPKFGESSLKMVSIDSSRDAQGVAIMAQKKIDKIERYNKKVTFTGNVDGIYARLLDTGIIGAKHIISMSRLSSVNMKYCMGIYQAYIAVMKQAVADDKGKKYRSGQTTDPVTSPDPNAPALPKP